ncbi:MAG: hypothetical protein A4E70_02351 [Syntrophus sp. PtaU1.Bin005]|uniref:DUF364 domain-containing protein n=1 Tax=Syntrophus TaxID=43773 RepID=UPI0009CD4646|nr:MAG: hypothetical protein A4E69_02727 [Syntrophus sp. PtaB.Bin138]OPY78623.1 MAG: hypothetical protein A4E70_02351 [Syntrophus sp. PtaU1.Bin005]
MELDDRMYRFFEAKAQDVLVEQVTLGLGYTAVTTSDGGIGIAYTYFTNKGSCTFVNRYEDFEGKPALELLEKIKSPHPLEKTMAVALVNALNYRHALSLPEDRENKVLFESFRIGEKTRVAMVGDFAPVARILKEKGALVEVIDIARGIGSREDFYGKLRDWAQVMVLTSTSILNNTTEEIFQHTGSEVKTVLLGPSTPMIAEVFSHLPVHMLAGTVPIDKDKVLKAVRHGVGTRVIQRFSRKSYLSLT